MRLRLQDLKNIYHWLQAQWWRAWYRWPDRGLTLYGVTGTNGKTTTSMLLGSVLREAYGRRAVGLLSTIVFWIGEREIVNETKLTTLASRAVFRYLRVMKDSGVQHVVLEMTSHALEQHRLAGIQLDGAIILNVTREHLDYHHTMEEYAAAKERIVRYVRPRAPIVGKGDDAFVAQMLTRAAALHPTEQFTSASAAQVPTALPGAINHENAAAVQALAQLLGIEEGVIERGLLQVTSAPGRMEWLELSRGVRAVIDYAVTPDALRRLYDEVRTQTSGRIFAILGGTGKRDRGKRPIMARIVAERADELLLTREDPWTEPEEQIFTDLEAGLKDMKASWRRIVDRREAIRFALTHAQAGDVIVATGKGAETGMAIGTEVVPWHERTVFEEEDSKLAT